MLEKVFRGFKEICPLIVCATLAAGSLQAQGLREPEFMKRARVGFDQIYNLDYDHAKETFLQLRREVPNHPAPPLYLSVLIWLNELFERQDLDLDRFVAPGHFTRATSRSMDPKLREAFFEGIEESRRLCERILEEAPENRDARYLLGSTYGILASFRFTIDRDTRQAFGYGRRAHRLHRELIEEDPSYYDAYLSTGLYEYITANLPWYIRWLAVLAGYRGNEERGFRYLQLAADKGSFVSDDAKTLLMGLYLRTGKRAEALRLARLLHTRFPRNFILHLNQAQIFEKMGKRPEAAEIYREVLERAEAQRPNYQKLSLANFRQTAGRKFMDLGSYEQAVMQFRKAVEDPDTPPREKALSHLGLGQVLDLMSNRSEAKRQYEEVLELPNVEDSHRLARNFLNRPFRRD